MAIIAIASLLLCSCRGPLTQSSVPHELQRLPAAEETLRQRDPIAPVATRVQPLSERLLAARDQRAQAVADHLARVQGGESQDAATYPHAHVAHVQPIPASSGDERPAFAPANATLPQSAYTGQYDGYTEPAYAEPEDAAAAGPQLTYPGDGFTPVPEGYCGPEFGLNSHAAAMGMRPWAPPGIKRPWPHDEYICDGGDKHAAVAVGQDWAVRGLDIEDTVAHFDTLDGRTLVEASNKVCIYAPRFAAVRQVKGLGAHEGQDRMAANFQPEQIIRHDDIRPVLGQTQQLQPVADIGARGVSIFRDRQSGLDLWNAQRLVAFQDALMAHEHFRVIGTGELDHAEGARLAEKIVAAETWTTNQAVQAIVEGKTVSVLKHAQKPQDTTRYDAQGKPALYITKIASAKEARPGEVVDFTIRFDNAGTQPIGNVTILDNLTTRLEYVEGSAQCSLKANFFTLRNEAESLVLRWEIVDPLEVGRGGIIRFRCRLR